MLKKQENPSLTVPAVVNCQMSDWTNCNSSCGPGKITRKIIEQAKNGGVECEKQLVKECNLGVCPDITIEGKLTTYKREAVPGEDDAYKFTPYRILNDGKQSRIEFKNFLEQIEYSNDADDFVNDFINALKGGAIFDEYI